MKTTREHHGDDSDTEMSRTEVWPYLPVTTRTGCLQRFRNCAFIEVVVHSEDVPHLLLRTDPTGLQQQVSGGGRRRRGLTSGHILSCWAKACAAGNYQLDQP